MQELRALMEKLKELAPALELREQEPMSRHTTFRVGGPAALMALPKNRDEAIASVRSAAELGIRPMYLCNGSNMLVMDGGLDRFVIKAAEGMDELRQEEDRIIAGSGALLSRLAVFAKEGGMTGLEFVQYLISQFLGGIAGAAVLMGLIGTEHGLGANGLFNGDVLKSLIIEIILTFVFVLAVLGATSKIENGKVAGLVIGGSLTLVHLFGIFFTGTSVNPARSLGPAIFMGGDALSCVWVFIVAGLIGGVLAALVWKGLYGKKAA